MGKGVLRLLEIHELTKQYGDKLALDRFSAKLEPGIYALLGPNGAGKSTLMNILAGILEPTSGEVLYNGVPISRMGKDYRSILGYLPQVSGYYKNFTAAEFLTYMAALKGLEPGKPTQKKVEKLLERMNLREDAKRKVGQFSGGMRQRLGIAQALLNDPEFLILDEPTAGLDPKERIRFRNLISEKSLNKIVLLATHIVSDVENLAGTVLLLQKGRLTEMGSTEECVRKMEGKVFLLELPEKEAEAFMERYPVTSMIKTETGVQLRVLSNVPVMGATPASPTLEDLYLYHFGEVSLT